MKTRNLEGMDNRVLRFCMPVILAAAIVLALSCFGSPVFAADDADGDGWMESDRTLLMAHRGAEIAAPENTTEAVAKAYELGYDGIEIDPRRSKDGVLFLMHDDTVDRTTNGTGRLSDMTADDVRALEIDTSGYSEYADKTIRVPDLEAVLRVVEPTDLIVNIDCSKEDWTDKTLIKAVMGLIEKYHLTKRCFFVISDPAARETLVEMYPDVVVSWLWDGTTITSTIESLKKYAGSLISIHDSEINSVIIKMLKDNHIFLQVYGVDSEERYQELCEKKVGMIETDKLSPSAEYRVRLDPRPDNVSKVRDQYWGTCWAQAGISTAESFLIKNGLIGNDEQMSVEDVLWWAQGESIGRSGGWNLRQREDGGYAAMSTGFLTTSGLRSEADIPYFGRPSDGDKEKHSFYGMGENQKPAKYNSAPVKFEVTDMMYKKSADIMDLKKMVVRCGAVSVTYRDSVEGFNKDKSSYWSPYYQDRAANHAVSIVGWDDQFSREDFVSWDGRKPSRDGAWIIKNSYGENYGSDGGYTFISYDDGYILKTDELDWLYGICAARKPAGLKRYMYDEFGAVESFKSEDRSLTAANVFNFGKNERIVELSFVTWTEKGAYHLYYAPVNGGVPSADKVEWKSLSKGQFDYAGYHTVNSSYFLDVPSGKGAVILVIESDSDTAAVGIDAAVMKYNKPVFNPKMDRGVSFVMDKDAVFKPAKIKVQTSDEEYDEDTSFSIRAYTNGKPESGKKGDQDYTPKKTVIRKVGRIKGGFRVSWKKVAGATGYQIQYSTRKNFRSGTRTVTIKGSKNSARKVRKLKRKKTYYVRMRTYRTKNGKTYRSAWTRVKKVKTR